MVFSSNPHACERGVNLGAALIVSHTRQDGIGNYNTADKPQPGSYGAKMSEIPRYILYLIIGLKIKCVFSVF